MKGRDSRSRELNERKQALEARVASLAGARITGVRYVELRHEGLGEQWAEHPELDSLDFGLELDLDDGRTISMAWDWEFESHDLNVYDGPLQPDRVDADAAIHDVADRSRWSELIGRRIENARLDWATSRSGFLFHDAASFPNDLILSFGDGRTVWIMAAEKRGDDWLPTAMDHLSVVFDDATARRLGRSQEGSSGS